MIQQINESEKNRIRNLHREHFILNENKGDYPDIRGFKKKFMENTSPHGTVLEYKSKLKGGNVCYLTCYMDTPQHVTVVNTNGKPLDKEIGDELSKHGEVQVRGGEGNMRGGKKKYRGSMFLVKKIKNINNLINGIKPILTKLYK